MKVVIRPRPKPSSNDANGLGLKRSSERTMEERKEEYDRARARIFSSSINSESEDALSRTSSGGTNLNVNDNDNAISGNLSMVVDREIGNNTSRVAILRDREKDRTDPDYDRSYDRYVKSFPTTQSFTMAPFSMQKFHSPFVQYDSFVPQLTQMSASQASLNYSTPAMIPYCAMGLNQNSRDVIYMQWPTQSMMYAESYDQLRQGLFQAPFFQQPLSFDYAQNHHR